MATVSPAQQARSDLGAAIRRGDPPEAVEAARRALRAAVADTYIERLTACVPPPLTSGQRERLAVLLLGPADGGET
jgi:hypothetical protein